MTTLDDLLPADRLPKGASFLGKDPHWYLNDDLASYRRHGGHPLYGERDIVYKFNRHGYRAPEFDATGDLRIISIGDETPFGFGLPEQCSFPSLLAKRLSDAHPGRVVHWNLSFVGASCDFVARVLLLVAPKLQPHLVLVHFPRLGRREFVTATGAYVPYVPGLTGWDAVSRDVFRNTDVLLSTKDDQVRLFRNYKAVETALYDCDWVFSLAAPEELTFAEPHLDARRRVRNLPPWVDMARNQVGPGPAAHAMIADLYWETLGETGCLDRIAAQLGAASEASGSSAEDRDAMPVGARS
jgi:hypothetical protein